MNLRTEHVGSDGVGVIYDRANTGSEAVAVQNLRFRPHH